MCAVGVQDKEKVWFVPVPVKLLYRNRISRRDLVQRIRCVPNCSKSQNIMQDLTPRNDFQENSKLTQVALQPLKPSLGLIF